MDITHVTHLYRPSIGGIENYVHRLAESHRAAGHDVSIVTTDASLENGDSPLDPERDVTYCDTTVNLFRNPVSVELYRTLSASDPDLCHLHSPYFLPSVEAAAALPRDVPTVLTVHGFPPDRSWLTRLRNRAYRPVGQYILNRVDRTIVLGDSERRRLLDRFDVPPGSVRVVPNGIHPDEHDVPESAVEAFRSNYGVDPDTPTLLYVSRLVESKQPWVLVDTVREELPGVEMDVLMVGHGEDEVLSELRSRADDRVQFISNLPYESLQAAYHAADLFVHLSLSEGLSTVVLEAMNARLPIVSTPAGGLADALSHGETGWVLGSPPQTGEVGTAIRTYLDDHDLRKQVGEHNRTYVREGYDWADIASRIESVFYGVVDVGRKPRAPGVAPPTYG